MNEKNIVFITGEITEENADCIVTELINIAVQNEDEIKIFIRSEGGFLYAGLAIIDTMNFIKNRCVTIGMGETCSMGSFILAAGEKGYRYITPLASIMIHQIQSEADGSMPDIETQINRLRKDNETLLKNFAKNTGRRLSDVRKITKRDTWFSPQEAINYGIVDKIIPFNFLQK